jgi:hypothetical protein
MRNRAKEQRAKSKEQSKKDSKRACLTLLTAHCSFALRDSKRACLTLLTAHCSFALAATGWDYYANQGRIVEGP